MKGLKIKDLCSGILMVAGIVTFIIAVAGPSAPAGTDSEAKRLERKIERRLDRLERYADAALEGNPAEWMDVGKLPEDMTIYRYVGENLQSWSGVFSVADDNIGNRLPRITKAQPVKIQLLSDVKDSLSFLTFGPRSYLVREKCGKDVCVIYGLTVIDKAFSPSFNGVNPRFRLADQFSIKPVSKEDGTIVEIEGRPQFLLTVDGTAEGGANPSLVWTSFFLMIAAVLTLSYRCISPLKVKLAVALLLSSGAALWLWGRGQHDNFTFFSPTIYADGELFYSLGATIILNMVVTLICVICNFSKSAIYQKSRLSPKAILISSDAAFLALLSYSFLSLRSLLLNSSICLEFYKFHDLTAFSWIVCAAFLTMFACFPLLIDFSNQARRRLGLRRIVTSSRRFRLIYSISIALGITVLSSVLGFRKEQNRLEIWANKLTLDRDISLEMDFKKAENDIAEDPIIASLTAVGNGEKSIEARLSEVYFPRFSKHYDFSVVINPERLEEFTRGEPVADNSHLFISHSIGKESEYGALFFYNVPGYGLSSLVIRMEQLSGTRIKGYGSILGLTPPGRSVVPSGYAFARYRGRRMTSFDGNFAYETKMDDRIWSAVSEKHLTHIQSEGYTHFIYRLPEKQTVLISRRSLNFINYFIEATLLSMFLFVMLTITQAGRRRPGSGRSYYRTRITWVLMSALLLTLIILALVSVVFVYDRNESNARKILSEKINSTRALLEDKTRGAVCTEDLLFPDMPKLLQNVAESSNSDITLYSPDGRVLMSTAPFVFERLILGIRMNGEAYDNVIGQSRRFYINKERLGKKRYYNIYAPLNSNEGDLIAIISSTYAEESYDFEKDAVSHSMTIVTVFLLLLLISRVIATAIVDKMFAPLKKMSRKMSEAGLDTLEAISYEQDDEITPIVNAYNRMMSKLSESSKQLAQAERDKAWSGMARQVAHEIKNPLTPMKLQVQRLMRLKDRNDPLWQDKFDEVSKILLDHIDILSDTANEFSSFAKLYTEEPTEINLDEMLREEISMFDSKSDVRFEYLGLKDSIVSGPKPQFTRVIVNLLNNAVQALDGKEDGRITVSLRNSGKAGFYDIVFEDNGPGVSEENLPKLFTPNFTTKNGGSGLGLAISRSILERCGACLAYSKSFSLGGACFTIQYPKDQTR